MKRAGLPVTVDLAEHHQDACDLEGIVEGGCKLEPVLPGGTGRQILVNDIASKLANLPSARVTYPVTINGTLQMQQTAADVCDLWQKALDVVHGFTALQLKSSTRNGTQCKAPVRVQGNTWR